MTRVVKTRKEFEGHWYEERVVVEGEGLSAWEAGADLKAVGRGWARLDGAERVTGRALFTSDIHLPGMLHGKILRSPHPHARIRKVDPRAAEDLPGVHLVLTHRNVPPIPFHRGLSFLFDETVRFAGDEVACAIAEEEELAKDALGRIEVEYEPRAFVLDPEEALRPGAPELYPGGNLLKRAAEVYERGDVRRGLEEATVVVEEVFRTATALHNSLETHGSVALWEGEALTVWDSTQHIFGVRSSLSELLQIPLHQVRVIKKYMGGGFGSKNQLGKYTLLAAVGARLTGRPVRILLDRHEENLAAGNRPASVQYLKVGARRDGTLTAIDLKVFSAAGAYAFRSDAVGGPVRRLYACPNVRTEQNTAFTNTGPFSAFRAPGYVEGTFALESAMDELARRLDLDPLQLRLKNYADMDPLTNRPYSLKGLREAYEIGAERFGWKGRKGELEGPVRRGFGLASQIWGGSGGPPAYALVKINPDGTAIVLTGTQDIGTGTKTALAQIAAEELGLPVESVSVEIGDTQVGPYSPISAGSMTLASVGPAVRTAAHDARRQLLEVASEVLSVPAEELLIQDGRLQGPGLPQPVPVSDLLLDLESFMVIGRGARSPNPEEVNVNTFGAQFAEVAVDTETGEVRVERVVAVHESGRVINPLILSSQVEGGITQGLGYGLMEERILDREAGIVLNAGLENYKIPTMADTPEILVSMVDRPDPQANNLGSKGVGEPPIIPAAAAVANAVSHALGTRIRELPISRDRVLKILARQGKE